MLLVEMGVQKWTLILVKIYHFGVLRGSKKGSKNGSKRGSRKVQKGPEMTKKGSRNGPLFGQNIAFWGIKGVPERGQKRVQKWSRKVQK